MDLTGVYDPENLFARIIQGTEPCFKVYEDEVALAFMDAFPQADGHALVIPKRARCRNFLDLPPSHIGDYMQRVQRVTGAVVRCLRPDGVELHQFNGVAAGQTVFHLHFHIIPRTRGVAILEHNKAVRGDDARLCHLASRISECF